MTLAAKHPETFSSASSMSGILNIINHGEKWQIEDRLGGLEGNRERWAAHSAWELAPTFNREQQPRLLFDCGTEDTMTGAWQDSLAFHQRLVDLNIPHVWRPFPGGHTWEYWSNRLPQHLNFHQANFMEHLEGETRAFTHYFKRLRAFHDEIATTQKDDNDLPTLCLLGSSSAEGMADSLFPGFRVYNRGISSDVLGIGPRGIAHRMEESIFDFSPDIVVLKNGRNDLGDRARNGTPSIGEMIDKYEAIIDEIHLRLPGTQVIVTTSFPTRGRFDHLAEAIDTFNTELKELATRMNVTLIDIHPDLSEKDSLLLDEEFSADGLHLNNAGKQIWANAILRAVKTSDGTDAPP